MIIVEPSFTIQTDLDTVPLDARLEACARVCYKSEGKITEGSAKPFVEKLAANGQGSVLEMAVISFEVICHPDFVLELLSCQPKYLVVDRLDNGMLVTGSIRTYRELYKEHPDNAVVSELVGELARREPYLFATVFDEQQARAADPTVTIRKLTQNEVEQLPEQLYVRHRFVSVKFVVNRAVSHELVRHRPCSFLQESQRYCRYNDDRFDNQVSFVRPMFFAEDSAEYSLWKQTMALAEKNYLELLQTVSPQAARTVLPNSCKTELIVYCNLLEWGHIFAMRCADNADPSMREVMLPLREEMRRLFPAV